MNNKIYSKGGENEIIINDNNIPKHNHFAKLSNEK